MQESVGRGFRQHEQRRLVDIPTVTLLLGEPAAVAAERDALCVIEGLASVVVDPSDVLQLSAACLRAAAKGEDLSARALAVLAQATATPWTELAAHLRVGSPDERARWFERTLESTAEPRLRGAIGWLSEGREPLSPAAELGLLCSWLPRALWPVPSIEQPTAAALAAVAELVSRIPALPALVSMPRATWRQLAIELRPHAAATLAEGEIVVSNASDVVPEDAAPSPTALNPSALWHDALQAKRQAEAAVGGTRRTLDERARSLAERLLFGLLEEHVATRGLFRLNGAMPFPFGGRPAEVDLVCDSLRIALEVDGYWHFANDAAYRRDRRKDVLLQTHGFVVMRHLASDVVQQGQLVVASVVRLVQTRLQGGLG
ncbi:MAG: DUF559 domain-containing protein [Polyangiales bacterium]